MRRTGDTWQITTSCLLQTKSKSCLMVCLSVMMLVCSPIPSPVRSLSTATGTLASRASWAASTSAPRTWRLTLLEVGVTGSMRLSAPTASQPRGYKSGKRPVMLTSEAKEWSAVIYSNTGWDVRCGRGQTNYSRSRNVRKIVCENLCCLDFIWIWFIGKFSPLNISLSFFKKKTIWHQT